MSRELNRFNTNLKSIRPLVTLIPRAVGLPKIALEKLFLPVFKNVCSSLIMNLVKEIVGNDEDFLKLFQSDITLSMDRGFKHLEKRLKAVYTQSSSMALKNKTMQRIKKLNYEAILVLLVAYFEDFLKASFISQINKKPIRSLAFIKKQLRIEDLKEFNFNLSRKMGFIIAGKINFQNLDEAAKVYKRAFNFDIFKKSLELKKIIINLFQTRHLIVHSNSRINKEYVKKAKCRKNQLGKRLSLSKKDIERFEEALRKVAEHIDKNRLK